MTNVRRLSRKLVNRKWFVRGISLGGIFRWQEKEYTIITKNQSTSFKDVPAHWVELQIEKWQINYCHAKVWCPNINKDGICLFPENFGVIYLGGSALKTYVASFMIHKVLCLVYMPTVPGQNLFWKIITEPMLSAKMCPNPGC